MRRLVSLLALSLLPAFAQAGTIQISPLNVSVDNTKTSQDITLTYTPSSGARSLEVSLTTHLERLGWARVEAIASPAAGVKVLCSLTGGQVRALVFAPDGSSLPVTTFALCRLRVRPHAHTPSATWYSIVSANAYETDANFNSSSLANAWSGVYVP